MAFLNIKSECPQANPMLLMEEIYEWERVQGVFGYQLDRQGIKIEINLLTI